MTICSLTHFQDCAFLLGERSCEGKTAPFLRFLDTLSPAGPTALSLTSPATFMTLLLGFSYQQASIFMHQIWPLGSSLIHSGQCKLNLERRQHNTFFKLDGSFFFMPFAHFFLSQLTFFFLPEPKYKLLPIKNTYFKNNDVEKYETFHLK